MNLLIKACCVRVGVEDLLKLRQMCLPLHLHVELGHHTSLPPFSFFKKFIKFAALILFFFYFCKVLCNILSLPLKVCSLNNFSLYLDHFQRI